MVFVVDNDVYICNVGDSRAIASISKFPDSTSPDQTEATSQVKQISVDHKPSEPTEFKRIIQSGGHVYQT